MKKEMDERVAAESNKIYKTCFIALCVATLIDLVVKTTAWFFSDRSPGGYFPIRDGMTEYFRPAPFPFYFLFLFQAIALLGIFLACVFMLARKGIVLTEGNSEFKRFPAGRYAIISAIVAVVIFLSIISTRLIIMIGGSFASEFGVAGTLLLGLLIFAVIVIPIFLFLYFIFFIAYKFAEKCRGKTGE